MRSASKIRSQEVVVVYTLSSAVGSSPVHSRTSQSQTAWEDADKMVWGCTALLLLLFNLVNDTVRHALFRCSPSKLFGAQPSITLAVRLPGLQTTPKHRSAGKGTQPSFLDFPPLSQAHNFLLFVLLPMSTREVTRIREMRGWRWPVVAVVVEVWCWWLR